MFFRSGAAKGREVCERMAIKALLIAGIVIAAAGAVLLTAVCVCAGRKRTIEDADCIIVLGARVWPDGRMSTTLLRRCERALEVWQEGSAPKLIVCGGRGGDEPDAEGAVMRSWLVGAGVPEEDVIAETESVNTAENLKNARAIMAAQGWRSAIVVSSDYHVQRALWIARDQGVQAVGAAAPSPDRLVAWMGARLRECVSWVLYALRRH